MRLPPLVLAGLLALAPFAFSACDGPTRPGDDSPDPRPERTSVAESELTFVRFAPDAPPLVDTVVSFWAVRGETRRVEIRYEATSSYGQGGICLEFRVGAGALVRHADGRTLQPGDSVHITIRVVNKDYFKFEFEPAGLQFDPASPAELRVWYDWRDRDHNGNGAVDGEDERIDRAFGFWRQEQLLEPWERITTERDETAQKARALIPGFTRYALASN